MTEKELYPRHGGSSHYANIPSGYYLLLSCFIFVSLIIITRKYFPHRTNQRFVNWIYGLNPIFLFLYFTSTIIILVFPLFIIQHDHYYNIFTKRLGRIAYGFTNLITLLMLQEPLSIFNGMVSYLEFIPLHKWLSRGIFGISIVHGIMFIVKWYCDPEVKLWDKMVVKKANFIGLIIFIEFCFMLIISIKPFRHKSYNLFYLSHQLINLTFIILIPFHARPTVTFPFLFINLSLMAVYCLNKIWQGHRISISDKVETFENQFYIITLPSTGFFKRIPLTPGSHIKISPYTRYDLRYWLFPSHPYTIVTSSHHEVKLIIKKTNFIIDENHQYSVCGPFPNYSLERLIQCEENVNNIILIAGGSGISFILPLYYYLLNNKDATVSFQSIKIIWLIKDIVEYHFIKNNTGMSEEYFQEMDIYITGTAKNNITGTLTINDSSNEEDIELQIFIPIRKENNKDDMSTIENKKIKYGRINWDLDLQEICLNNANNRSGGNNTNNYIIGCGPDNLIKDCETFGSKNNYHVITEHYSL